MASAYKEGHKAYKEALSQGKSKQEAKSAQKQAREAIWHENFEKQLPYWERDSYKGNKRSDHQKESDFNSDVNENGTRWHTSDDL